MKSNNRFNNNRFIFKDGSVFWFGMPGLLLFLIVYLIFKFFKPEHYLFVSFALIPVIFITALCFQKLVEKSIFIKRHLVILTVFSWLILFIYSFVLIFNT